MTGSYIWIIGETTVTHLLQSLAASHCIVKQHKSVVEAREAFAKLPNIITADQKQPHVIFYIVPSEIQDALDLKTGPFVILRQWRKTTPHLRIIAVTQRDEIHEQVKSDLLPDLTITFPCSLEHLMLAFWQLYGTELRLFCGNTWAINFIESGEACRLIYVVAKAITKDLIKARLRGCYQKLIALPDGCSLEIFSRIVQDYFLYDGLAAIGTSREKIKQFLKQTEDAEDAFLGILCHPNPQDIVNSIASSPDFEQIARGRCPEKEMWVRMALDRIKPRKGELVEPALPGVLIIGWHEQTRTLIEHLKRFFMAHKHSLSIIIYDPKGAMSETEVAQFRDDSHKNRTLDLYVRTPEDLVEGVQFTLGMLHLLTLNRKDW